MPEETFWLTGFLPEVCREAQVRPLRATMLAQRVAAMFDKLRDQVVAMVQEHEQQGSQVTELQGQLAAQTQRVEALEAELQGLRQLLVQDAEESETETRTPPSPAHKVDSPTSGSDGSETRSDEEIELSRRAIANLLLKKLYARVGAEAEKTTEVEAFPQVEEPPDDGPEVTQWRCVWRPGMDIRGERSVQRKGVVGFLSSGEVFDVVEEWPGREGTVFLKLAGDKGWVFNKIRTGTFAFQWEASGRTGEVLRALPTRMRTTSPGRPTTEITSRDRGTTAPAATRAVVPARLGKAKTSGHGIRKTVLGALNSTGMQGTAKSPALLGKARKTSGHGIRKTMMVGALSSSMQATATSGRILGGTRARTRWSRAITLGDAAAFPSIPNVLI